MTVFIQNQYGFTTENYTKIFQMKQTYHYMFIYMFMKLIHEVNTEFDVKFNNDKSVSSMKF